jgi:acyl phosphate:glycerol-3-phosphate acyltransferase
MGSAILPSPTNMLALLQVIAVAYLIGSLPFSFLVARAFGVEDVRRVGSGNVGATNVLRSAGKAAGALALLLDIGKGAAASALAGRLAPGEAALPAVAAVAAVVGHMFPVWLRFEGGKGVATGLGAFAPLAPKAALGALVAFGLTALATRFVSLSSVAGGLALAGVAFAVRGPDPVAVAAAFTAALVVFRHRSNLRRILGGTERRMGTRPKE